MGKVTTGTVYTNDQTNKATRLQETYLTKWKKVDFKYLKHICIQMVNIQVQQNSHVKQMNKTPNKTEQKPKTRKAQTGIFYDIL